MPSSGQAGVAAIALAGAWLGLGEPGGFNAREFPAHDSHQGVTIAAVPVPDTPEAVVIFGKNAAPTSGGFLPMELIISNERAEAVRVALERIVVLARKEKLPQVEPEEIAWALYPPPKPKRPLEPAPDPSRVPRDKNLEKREETEAALRSRQLRAAVIGPGASARGYLYFDLRKKALELETTSVYVPVVDVVPTGEGLLFFEISLKPYAKPPA